MAKRILTIWSIALIFLSIGIFFPAYASTIDDQINELKTKIAELQTQENSLSKEISILNSNIELTTLRIDTTKKQIETLNKEIEELAQEITSLETKLTKRSELVLHRIPASYKRQSMSVFGYAILGNNISDIISRVKYITRVQEEDAQLLVQLKMTQNNFNERKDLREKKKTQQELLKKQLEEESKSLDRQKRQKQALLEQTKNSESVYQSLLAQAIAEKQAIERALVEGVAVGPIKKGDPIALVGNTGYPGCSTGAHLHFEIRKNNAWVNVEEYLSSRSVRDDSGITSIGSGSWDWPLEGDIIVTQRFGKTPWSWRYTYSNGIHTGIDMISNSSPIIRAPKDGTLYSSSQSCGGSSVIKIKYIEHGDGIVSFYLHVQ